MTKRNPGLPRNPHDNYPTPLSAARVVMPYLKYDGITFAEPCAGEGHLAKFLIEEGFQCLYAGDITKGCDALTWTNGVKHDMADFIITNPPWTRPIMHEMIQHFVNQVVPVWLLLDADWMHTKQAVPHLKHCTTILSVGRVKWMPDSEHVGYDNAAWYRFEWNLSRRCLPTFIPRSL